MLAQDSAMYGGNTELGHSGAVGGAKFIGERSEPRAVSVRPLRPFRLSWLFSSCSLKLCRGG